ncbi:MAG: hypothetical protein K8R31_00120 [Bacteroidales bacterium]|nr:hypothetical protein [Bacteroidales bacterium]
MENSEVQQDSTLEKNEMVIDKKSLTYLTETRKWTMFLAILGFIFIGLLAIGVLILGLVGAGCGGLMGGSEMFIIFVVYIVIGVLYFFPIYYLLKFSVNMKKAIEQAEQKDLTVAFEYLKSHYKFIGVLTIVIFGLYILIGIVAAIIGMASIF